MSQGMTKSRIAIGAVAVVVLGAIALRMLSGPGSPTAADGPVIIFSIDTLRADRLPAYGYTSIRTPHIDRLAADGLVFENAYSHSPQTLPSHTSLLSGRLPFEHGVRDNIGFSASDGERFLQRAFKDRGYATAGFVSSYVLRKQTGISQGFDLYDDQLPPASPDKLLGDLQRPGTETVASAIRWIDQQPSTKFMLFVHIYEPHTPYTPPQRFAAAKPYDGEVQYSDEIAGQLFDHLRSTGLYDPATIVLLSDHGEGLGDHGEDEHGIFLYRETIRVPLIVKLPASREAGRRVASVVQHIDIPPTLLDLTGGTVEGWRGRSLRPVIDPTPPRTNRAAGTPAGSATLGEAAIYSESLSPRYHFGWSELYALTDDRYRLIRAPRDELYDVQQDPNETTSIADARPQARTAMRRALDALIVNAPVNAPEAVSAGDREKLAALGYVGTQTGASLQLPGDQLPDPKDKIGVLQTYKRATELAGNQQYAEASALYRDLLRDEPAMTDVWLQLAGLYGRRGMVAEEAAAYKEVISRNPKNLAALIGMSSALLRIGRVGDARAHAELAVEVAPAAAHELLARIALSRGDFDAARREAHLAEAADPSLPARSFVEGVILHRQGQYAAALPHLLEAGRRLSARTEQIPDVHYLAGDAYARLDRFAAAEAAFKQELRTSPGHIRARAGLAMLYRATGRASESEQAIADLVRYSPTPEAYSIVAELWTMFGEPAKAAAARAESRRRPR
jgi:arylsulfatase A-like enzyme/tetratricopeptide (TPR) repeat protein